MNSVNMLVARFQQTLRLELQKKILRSTAIVSLLKNRAESAAITLVYEKLKVKVAIVVAL